MDYKPKFFGPPPIPDPTGGFITVIATIGGILLQTLGGGGGSTQQLTNALNQITTQVVNGLDITGRSLELLFGAIIPQFLGRIWDAIKSLRGLIARLLEKLAKVLKWLRDAHDYIFRRFIGPVLNSIQHIRQMLVLLRILHIKFAVKLDQTLAGIEYRIAGNFEAVWREINQVVSWAQLVVDLNGIFQPGPLWGAMKRDVNILRGLTGPGASKALPPDVAASVGLDHALFDSSAIKSRQAAWYAGKQPTYMANRAAAVRDELGKIHQA